VALFTVQVAVIVIWTVIVDVDVAARAEFSSPIQKAAANTAVNPQNNENRLIYFPNGTLKVTTLRNLLT
jgi:hypothetical protein